MKKISNYLLLIALLIGACTPLENAEKEEKGFSNKNLKLTSDKLTPELIWQLGRIGNVSVSPNQKQVLYTVSYTDIKENKSYSDIYLLNIEKDKIKQLTDTKSNEMAVAFSPDGKWITYLKKTKKGVQLFKMNLKGKDVHKLTDVKDGITGYRISPDMKKIAFTAQVKIDKDIHDMYPDLPKANAYIEDDLMYRHWNEWEDGYYSHVFISKFNEKGEVDCNNAVDIMEDQRFDAPLLPFGGIEQINWSADSKTLVYCTKQQVGKEYALSTNSNIFLYSLNDKSTTNLTPENKGYDLNPVFSPDGKYMAYESMERDGYESDKKRLMIRNMETGENSDYSLGFDQNASHLSWSTDSKAVWFTSNYHGCNQIYKLDMNSHSISKITQSVQNYNSAIPVDGEKVIATRTTLNSPTEIYIVDAKNGEGKNLSNVNTKILDKIKFGEVKSKWITTTNGEKMHEWIIYPPNFNPKKKYPTLLYCQGGPQSTVSQFWSLRWNFQLMAANGYIIVAPNRHGLPGFGQKWNEQISKDYGGQNMKDYLASIDDMVKEPYVDKDRLGAIGASYGGFSVYWLAGNHNKRFKAFVSHCGIFNFEQMYSTTEESFFVDWDLGGAYWDKDNKIAQRSYSNSPHKFVGKWDTPILVIHGEKDFRIPYTQGMGAYNSAKLRGISARFLYFPDECHWVLSPQNGILWHREFFRWLDEYLKEKE